LRVRVYGGTDPVSGKRLDLMEIVPPGPTAAREAEKVRTRMLNEVDERRNPRTKATLNQLLDQWLEVAELEPSTRVGYVRKIDRHIRPVLGDIKLERLDARTLENLYAQLRRCRDRCDGRRRSKHHTRGRHECDARCEAHECRPLARATVRQIHAILRAALTRAVKWDWIANNPAVQATPPTLPTPNPRPPTAEQAALILNEAWKDPDWGLLVWVAMITGARRGELCALRWSNLNLDTGLLEIRSALAQDNSTVWEKSTKTHQHRRITLDQRTGDLLRAHRESAETRAAAIGTSLRPDAFLFSRAPDSSIWLRPDAVSARFKKMCARLSIDAHLHQLRHYSATELIASGVDVRTVAGRLGHSGGGTTTLKVYSAWLSEADQRAAAGVGARMPAPPATVPRSVSVPTPGTAEEDGASPYIRIAADLQAAITCGVLRPGDALPTLVELAGRYGVAESTAHRAIARLHEVGAVSVTRGQRARVT
jgi:integrase